MTAPSISLTQNIVRVGMAELLEGGKVVIDSFFHSYFYRWLSIVMQVLGGLGS
jgi:hypothetical protein